MARTIIAFALLLVAGAALAQDGGLQEQGMQKGIFTIDSPYSVQQTANRLVKAIKAEGMKVIARVDHSAAAANVGKKLPPTELIIFGDPKVGSELMECQLSVALDLPQKMLVREENGVVSISYNDPHYLAQRHDIEGCDRIVTKMANKLRSLAEDAVAQ